MLHVADTGAHSTGWTLGGELPGEDKFQSDNPIIANNANIGDKNFSEHLLAHKPGSSLIWVDIGLMFGRDRRVPSGDED